MNDEILSKLYENGIQEEQIGNPALKITYHYYCGCIEKDREKEEETENRRVLSTKIMSKVESLRDYIKSLEKQIEELKNKYEIVSKAYNNLQDKFSTRIVEDEKKYQQSLSVIREFKVKINQLQSRGIFQVIGDKILGRNRKRLLTRVTDELPKTLYENKAEEVGMPEIEKNILIPTSGEQTQPSSDNRTEKDEMQK